MRLRFTRTVHRLLASRWLAWALLCVGPLAFITVILPWLSFIWPFVLHDAWLWVGFRVWPLTAILLSFLALIPVQRWAGPGSTQWRTALKRVSIIYGLIGIAAFAAPWYLQSVPRVMPLYDSDGYQ